MEVLSKRGTYPAHGKATAVALGYFDGVHRGHQQVIGQAQVYARRHGLKLAVFTFTSPLNAPVKGQRLMNDSQKHAALEALGVEYVFEPPFESFCALSPRRFVEEMLMGEYQAKAVFCGDDFNFGKNRAGNTSLLRRLCEENGIHLQVAGMAEYNNEPVSSSRIRQALQHGDISTVNAMLGYPYEVELPVVRGKQLGSTLGFPTLNQVYPPDMQPPKSGVYITQVVLNGRIWPSVTGYGNRPTVNGQGDTCETFIPGYSGNLYGQNVRVRFFKYIADTQRFSSVEELRAAVQRWAKQALAYFDEN